MKGVSLSKKTEQERLRLLYAPMLSNQIIGSMVVSVIMLILFSQQVSLWMLLPWVLIALTSFAYHIYLHMSFSQVTDKRDFSIKEWEHKFLLGVGLSAAVWGSACLLLYVKESISHQNYLALIISGISVVAMKLLSPSHKAMLIFSGLTLIPLAVFAYLAGSLLALPLLAYVLIQIYISYSHGVKFQHDYYTSQSLQYASKQRELKLRKSDERYRTWFKNSSDPLLLLSTDKILKANQAAVRMLGFDSAAKLLKTKPEKIIQLPIEDGGLEAGQLNQVKQALRDQGACCYSGTFFKQDSSPHPAEISLTAIPFKKGNAYFCAIRDTSDSQSTIQELKHEIALATRKNETKSAFYEHISQAVFTPMNGVLGNTNRLVQKNNLSHDQMMRARVIKRSAESLLGIFNNVLDVTKLDAGSLQLNERGFDMQALINAFAETAIERAESKGIQFKYHIDPAMHQWYLGDANRIGQMLGHLFDNALKFTQQGEIKLVVKMAKNNQAGAMLRFDFIDTGPGVKKAQQAHLFDRFSQADGSATGQVGGTGLGLSLTQGLARLMNGQVGYTTHRGPGAHFWFTIKLFKSAAIKTKPQKPKAKQKGIQAFDAKVLVVDDNRTSLLVAKGTLEVFGLDIELANSGAEAVFLLRKNDYDLVFMDCLMPKMDGYQTTAKIRSLATQVKNPNIPIIAMTSNDQEGDREVCIEAGMNDYITKPIDIRLIQQMLQFWLLKQQ